MTIENRKMRDRYETAANMPSGSIDWRAAHAADYAFEKLLEDASRLGLTVPKDDRAENIVTAIFAALIKANEIVERDGPC